MKKILVLAASLLALSWASPAQDIVSVNRAAVGEAQNIYNDVATRNSAKIADIQAGIRVEQQELSRLQSELNIAKAKEKHVSQSLKLEKKKLQLQRKVDTRQLSRDITKNDINLLKADLEAAKETRQRCAREVSTMKKSIASDKKQISALKKEINDAKKVVKQNEKTLKSSEKLQAAQQ